MSEHTRHTGDRGANSQPLSQSKGDHIACTRGTAVDYCTNSSSSIISYGADHEKKYERYAYRIKVTQTCKRKSASTCAAKSIATAYNTYGVGVYTASAWTRREIVGAFLARTNAPPLRISMSQGNRYVWTTTALVPLLLFITCLYLTRTKNVKGSSRPPVNLETKIASLVQTTACQPLVREHTRRGSERSSLTAVRCGCVVV